MDDDQEDKRMYCVVKSLKGYISIWLSHKKIPGGWFEVGKKGLKQECLQYIKENFPENPDMEAYKHYFKLS
jgi:MbtH protein